MANLLVTNWKGGISEERKGKPALLTRTCPPGLALAHPDMSKSRLFTNLRTCRV